MVGLCWWGFKQVNCFVKRAAIEEDLVSVLCEKLIGWLGEGSARFPDKERRRRQNFLVFVVWEHVEMWSVQVLSASSRVRWEISRFKSGREASLWSRCLMLSRFAVSRRSSGDSPGL